MASFDWRGWLEAGKQRVRETPRWVKAVGIGSVVAALIAIAVFARGPAYAPLYEGLSAHEGGQVIDKLQKLGIPYQLNSSGSVIRVPAPELARARLQLGRMGVPANSGSEAYNKLTQGSMTTSAVAEDALSKRALENRLRQAIEGIQGVGQARVTLALPKSTPFLKQQPHPKASVWLHVGPAGLSSAQAQAIAQMTANSVPGLDVSRVTVTDQNGNVLAPVPKSGLHAAQQQLRFTSEVEQRAQHHIQALLAPLIGAGNMRLSTAASIDYSQDDARAVHYGPNSKVSHLKHDTSAKTGQNAQGVPGALANQPPGNAAAPLQQAQKQANNAPGGQNSAPNGGNAQGNGQAQTNGQNAGASAASTQSQSQHSSQNKWNVQYAVDKSTTVEHRPAWQLKGLSVSVVLNQRVVGSHAQIASQIKQIVSNAVAAPDLKVNVAVVPFGLETTTTPPLTSWRAYVNNAPLMRALMEFLAALLFLVGLARPLSRWIRDALPVPRRPGWLTLAPRKSGADGEESEGEPDMQALRQRNVERAQEMARNRPEETAEMLSRWIKETGNDEAQHDGA